jgi:glycyl-tRNA synthetase
MKTGETATTQSVAAVRSHAERGNEGIQKKDSPMDMSKMDKLVSLCKRRGFIFQSSEIYGGLNGFWDYGPLGVELKRNLKEAWWHDMVNAHDDLGVLAGAPSSYEMVGLDCTIIMHPQVWKCSGHYDLFHDFMVDCRESKKRYRHDQVWGRWVEAKAQRIFVAVSDPGDEGVKEAEQKALKFFNLRAKNVEDLKWDGDIVTLTAVKDFAPVLGPDAKTLGTLTPPREFNLMFKTYVGALSGEEGAAFLRPETAQGIFVNFKNVVDSSRVRIPFGIGQMGKSFRNEITPRNFTFRSREFEQMEIEFFCHPKTSPDWYKFWRDRRYQWYLNLGLARERLRLRDHHVEELAHYSCGTADIEYAFPFLAEGDFGELEGVAHRADFDLRSHMEGKLAKNADRTLSPELGPDGKPKHRGSGKDLSYFDELSRERFIPHVIEPSAGADRGTLAFLCEAYQEDKIPDRDGKLAERLTMKLHPRLAPIKAAIFPLEKNNEDMKKIAQTLYRDLKQEFVVTYDDKGNIGRLYRRQDEAGTPYCITIDEQTLQDQTVTIRDRDTTQQSRIAVKEVETVIRERMRTN